MGRTLSFTSRSAPSDPQDPWPSNLTPGDRLQRLCWLAPDDGKAVIKIIDDQLRRRWPRMPSKRSG